MDREGGFIVLHRRIRSWPLWKFMSAEQRMVWVQILLDANWKDSEVWVGVRRATVKRGQLVHSENTIAKHAGVGRQVVRTTIEKLIVEGAVVRSQLQFDDAQTYQGQQVNIAELTNQPTRCPSVLTVLNYGKYQDVTDDANPRGNQGLTKRQPRANQAPTPSEQEEPVEPDEPPTSRAARAAKTKGPADPRHRLFIERAHAVAVELGNMDPDVADGRSLTALKGFLARKQAVTVEAWEARWRRLLSDQRAPRKLWFLIDRWDNYAGSAPPPPSAIAGRAKFGPLTEEEKKSWETR